MNTKRQYTYYQSFSHLEKQGPLCKSTAKEKSNLRRKILSKIVIVCKEFAYFVGWQFSLQTSSSRNIPNYLILYRQEGNVFSTTPQIVQIDIVIDYKEECIEVVLPAYLEQQRPGSEIKINFLDIIKEDRLAEKLREFYHRLMESVDLNFCLS